MGDYIPHSDADFVAWLTNFRSVLSNRGTALGITQPDREALDDAAEEFGGILTQISDQQSNLAALTQRRQIKRERLDDMSRSIARRLQAHPAMDDEARAAFRLTIRSTTRTPTPAPTTRPVVTVDSSQRLQHTLGFYDETTPGSRAKPDGVKAAEVRRAVSDAPVTDPEQMEFVALDSATPYLAEYTSEDAGKTASYVMRWVSKRDEPGPWGRTVSATIQG